MNKFLATLFAVAALAGVSLPAAAQPAPKIVVVDMVKLLDEHPETAEQNAKLKTDEARANEEIEKLTKEGQGLIDQLRKMEEDAKNPVLSTDAKEKLQGDMRAKFEEVQRKQQELQSYRGNTQRSFQLRIQNFRKVLFDRISTTVSEIAKKKGATLVFDKSGVTHIGLNPLVYADPAYDITAEVQTELLKTRPAGASTAPAPAAPAAAKPGATDDSAKVTFPGAK